jgi:hypothetical protein
MKSRRAISLALAAVFFGTIFLRAADDPFSWPPITAQQKPWAFNWWMGSAVDKTNLTHELERYAAAGLGGIHIIPIYGAKGFEDKYINYLSPQWMEMMGWAVSEAHRLGMGVDMTTGSGWCFGGPQVTDEDANASVVVKTFGLKAGEKLTQKFIKASTQALVAYGPDGKVIELTEKISADGEVDWIAPSSPVGRASRLSAPEGVSPSNSVASSNLGRDDLANAGGTPTPLAWTIYAISQKPSGQKVKRPGPGGEGWMLNLIYPHAMDDFLKPYTAAFANYTGPKPRAQYHDSYEYKSDWSPDFFAQFEKRRGYRLQTELPALFGSGDASSPGSATRASQPPSDHRARVLCDYRQTVSEIMADSLKKWVDWSHEHGFITRDQAHGSPGNWLDLYATADIPETEMFHTDKNKLISKFASSAAHVTGKRLVSAETGTWIEEHFTEKLSDVKYLFDDMFLSGINHMFYHGCIYSPDEAPWPGWHFYASLEMNPRNSIWRDVPALNAYAARCQAILQSGQPDNDILLYYNAADFWMQPGDKLLPQLTVHARDWFEGQPIGKVAKELWDKGYAFDYVSDAQLKTAKVVREKFPTHDGSLYEKGIIQMSGGKYKVIIVPECKFIPLETFRELLALAESGVTVIFDKNLPMDISGAADLESKRTEFKTLTSKLIPDWNMDHNERYGHYHIGKGFVFSVMSYPEGNSLDYQDELACETLVESNLSFARRSFDGGWNYFIANRNATNFDGWVTLGRHATSVVVLDPMTGNVGAAMSRQSSQRVSWAKENFVSPIEIHLQLKAGESVILRAFAHPVVGWDLPGWNYWQTNGQPVEITGDWKVKFLTGGPTLPADFSTAKLTSWTTFPDTNCQAFGGTAKYETTFDAPQSGGDASSPNGAGDATVASSKKTPSDEGVAATLMRRGVASTFYLDLGDVRQSARVRLNGKDYGTLITPPFRVAVDNLKPTGNTLEVEVTSVDANRIRDLDRRGVKWKNFRDINIVNLNYKPFDASDWPLTDCGLLGPVTLTLVTAEK